jgi:hypothetical protein
MNPNVIDVEVKQKYILKLAFENKEVSWLLVIYLQ